MSHPNEHGLGFRVKAWLIAARLFVTPWIAVNALLGTSLAGFNLQAWFLAFAITTLVLVSAHFINAWRDFVKGLDRVEEGSVAKPYTAGSQVLPRGWLSLRTVKASAIALLALSACLMVFAPRRLDAWLLYALGVAMALTYTDFFKPRGLGEVALFLGHGFGTTTFAYSLVRPIDPTGISAGILLGMWAGIVYTIDQYTDVQTDFMKKVRNLAYMVFKANVRISQLWYFLLTATLTMQMGFVILGWLPKETLLSIFCLPLGHVAGILIDYNFERGTLLCLVNMWFFALLMSLGILLL